MKNLYVLTFRLPTGHMLQYAIVASSRAKAEAKAAQLAEAEGMPAGTEPHTSQTLHENIAAIED